MSPIDVAKMALHNLWSRKLRTFLNILGVVMACVVLTMMLAGTRGVDESFDRMINSSEDIRRFGIYRHWKRESKVPPEVTKVDGEMSEARRARLQGRLREAWLRANATRPALDGELIEVLKALPHMHELRPEARLLCSVQLGEAKQAATIWIAGRDRKAHSRVLVGEYLAPDDTSGILLGEYAALRLGYVSDSEIAELVGKKARLTITMGRPKTSPLRQLIGNAAHSMEAIKNVARAVDQTTLSESDKKLLQTLVDQATVDPTDGKAPTLELEVTIRGIVREAEKDDGVSLFNLVGSNTGADIYMTADRSSAIEMEKEGFTSFYAAIGVVDEVTNLGKLTESVEDLGFRTRSSWGLVERIDEEIGKVRVAVGALSVLILLISALGISNTMVVSVLERVREFGILKALGAQDKSVMLLMLMEGALTGLVGALVGIGLSISSSQLVTIVGQKYISQRIRESYEDSVFVFSIPDLLLVVGIAIAVCTVAAILPAWRAAKLDPVVAMRGL